MQRHFRFFIFLAALGAYPASLGHKVYGALLSMPAFFAYGALRLVILGAIANSIPDLLRFFHLYFMVVLNLGFVMMLWITWIRRGALLYESITVCSFPYSSQFSC